MESVPKRRSTWTFLTNHARVLSLIARDPAVRLRDVARTCELTERAVQAIVADLEADGYLERSREGRRNRYHIVADTLLRHPAEGGVPISALLGILANAPTASATEPSGSPAAESGTTEEYRSGAG